ncbi:hypothetical protein HJC23_008619 [Cyclotella cryptica]|uniref:PDZ domain-containing protein n=1 Tax=Cyclotella cryptica TaxID=29204 RepID=A0ABD3Q713_9STRA
MMFQLSLSAGFAQREGSGRDEERSNEPMPCPYSPHPKNRKLNCYRATLASECTHNNTTRSTSYSCRSLPALIYYSDTDESDCSVDDNADETILRADANALSLENLERLAIAKFGTSHLSQIKHQYITAPSGDAGVKLEIKQGLIVVKKISIHSPLFGILHKYDIISTIDGVDLDGFTAKQAEELFIAKGKRQCHLVSFRIHREESETTSPESSIAPDENDICFQGDIGLIL